MPLKGDLGSIDLAHVFQLLALNEEAGVLEIFADGVRTLLYFGPKGVQLPYDPRSFPEKVVRLLERRSKLTPDQLSRARSSLPDAKVDLLAALVHMRVVNEDEVVKALREQTEEEIYELFVAADASFEFREGELPPPDKVLNERCVLSGNALILEAARRIDDWCYIRRLVPHDGEIYEPVATLAAVTAQDRDDALDAVFHACDGIRTVSGLVEETHLPRYAVCKKLAMLVEQGIVAPVPADVLLERANQCMHSQRLNDALRLYEKAIAGGCRDPALPEMAGLAYQSVLEYARAAKQYAIVADQAEAQGNLKVAVEMHLRIRELLTTDINSRIKLLEIHARAPELFKGFQYDALNETVEVALILRELSRSEESMKLVRDSSAKWLQNATSALRMADLAIELGDPHSAVETLLNVGDRMLGRRDLEAAQRMYRRVKAIDPQHPGVGDRLERIQAQIARRVTRRTRLTGSAVAAMVLGLAGLGYGYYSKHARDAYRLLPAQDRASRGDYRGAIESYQRFRRAYPFTFWSVLAREKSADLELARRRQTIVDQDLKQLRASENQQAQQNAENLAAEARRLILANQPERGLELLRKARQLATSGEWLKQEKIDEQIDSLAGYFAGARALAEQAQAFRTSGDHQNEYAALRDLVRKYPLAPEAAQALLPVYVESAPSGASVRVIDTAALADAQQVATATTPAWLALPARDTIEIEFSKLGFERERRKAKPLAAAEVKVVLRRSPMLSLTTGIPCAFVQQLDADHVLIGSRDGRLQVWSVRQPDKVWQASLPEMEEIVGEPLLKDGMIWIAGRRGTLLGFAATDGTMTAPRHLPIAPGCAPVAAADRLAVAGDAKVVIVGKQARDVLAVKTLDAAVRGLFGADQQLLVWLEHDRLVELRASDGEALGTILLPSKTSAVHLLPSGQLACGTEAGELVLIERDGSRRWHTTVSEHAITDITAARGTLIVTCGGTELVAVGQSGERLGAFTAGRDLRLARHGNTARLLAVCDGSRMLDLELPSLVLRDEFSITGRLRTNGVADDQHAFFGSEEGSLFGFLIE
ncbi:MAG: DUF4388 domain-containing protein [Planctomycetota bacterium]